MPRTKTFRYRTIQESITKKYPEQIISLRKTLCRRCHFWRETYCLSSLLPITSTGEDCPYFHHDEGKEPRTSELP